MLGSGNVESPGDGWSLLPWPLPPRCHSHPVICDSVDFAERISETTCIVLMMEPPAMLGIHGKVYEVAASDKVIIEQTDEKRTENHWMFCAQSFLACWAYAAGKKNPGSSWPLTSHL